MSSLKTAALAVLIVTLGLVASIHLGNADALPGFAPVVGSGGTLAPG